jgi:hypothetical protein
MAGADFRAAMKAMSSWERAEAIRKIDPPPLKWSDLNYVSWHPGGPICRGSIVTAVVIPPSSELGDGRLCDL